MRVNAAKRGMKQKRGMFAALIRLLMIASFILMPLSMLGTPAVAVEHAPAAASVPCESHGEPSKAQHENRAHCASCVGIAQPQTPLPPAILQLAPDLNEGATPFLLGHLNDVATPPPKAA
ncbi:hypothetical protein GCM10011515_15550 [Tsuneonella deserti]|uniref:DUF2946 domain-containing protein n=1 Tax=Tsuneonella deserti TaxID=2035528 RepID=A0ABQ1S8Y0_9SPHN|nr:hypothetical protein GCM10011515_15550 [Tsuneonella deserti]